jgi:hypothetical protein
MLLRKKDKASPLVYEGPKQETVNCGQSRHQKIVAGANKPKCLMTLLVTAA